MDVVDAAAMLADEVVMGVLVGGLEERSALAEIGAQHEPVGDEHIEVAVDGGGVWGA